MGLVHSSDLDAWARWQRSRRGLRDTMRAARDRLKPPAEAGELRLFIRGEPRVLAALDSPSPSNRAAVLAPLEHLLDEGLAVLANFDAKPMLQEGDWREVEWDLRSLKNLQVVLALGHYLAAGSQAYQLSVERDIPFGVVQHGLLTPFAPPLPFRATVLAWSEQDGDFWASGRQDLEVLPVGSQLFHNAVVPEALELVEERHRTWAQRSAAYLGQLHGAEMDKRRMASAAGSFCLRENALYRPHPGEKDVVSRAIHSYWKARGIRLDTSGAPLRELNQPVVGVFSTGVLEAAAAGIPAYVEFPKPPGWLLEFWQRYSMENSGSGRWTAPPLTEGAAPAEAIARWAKRFC